MAGGASVRKSPRGLLADDLFCGFLPSLVSRAVKKGDLFSYSIRKIHEFIKDVAFAKTLAGDSDRVIMVRGRCRTNQSVLYLSFFLSFSVDFSSFCFS